MAKETTSGTSTNVKAALEEGIGALMADEVIASVDPNAIQIPEGMTRLREYLGKGEKLHLILKGFCERSHKAWKLLTPAQSKIFRAFFELMLERMGAQQGGLNEQGGSPPSPVQSGGSGTARASGGTGRRKNSRFSQELRAEVKAAVAGGMTPAEVESKFGVPRQTLANWKQDWKRERARAEAKGDKAPQEPAGEKKPSVWASTAKEIELAERGQAQNQGPNKGEGQGGEAGRSSENSQAPQS